MSKYINLRPIYTDGEQHLLEALREAAQKESDSVADAVQKYLINAVQSESQHLTPVKSDFPDLTPLQRFQGIQAVELLVKRNMRRLRTDDVAAMPDGSVRFGSDVVKRKILVNEIASYAGIRNKDGASQLLDWIWTTSRRVPLIFPEFTCRPDKLEVILKRDVNILSVPPADLGESLANRWRPSMDKALLTR